LEFHTLDHQRHTVWRGKGPGGRLEGHVTSEPPVSAAPAALLRTLQDRYLFERELGSGGMATVYLARDLQRGVLVAVKVLRPELVPLLGAARFAREIRITASLRHPNILPVLDSGEAEGVHFYVTPYVDGESLAQLLEREEQLPIEEALDIACQIADALETAHAKGFVHRDIKPSNILLSGSSPPAGGAAGGRHAVLTDFGIARAVDVVTAEKLTESGMALGTPSYMSPEQSGCSHIDGRSDIYSLGCVVFEMLAGSPPFTGPTPLSVRARHAVDPPPSLRTVRTTVSPALEQAVDKALAKVPADRFHSAAEFAQALTAGCRPLSLWRRLILWRHQALAAALGLISILGIWALAGSSVGSLDPNKVVVFPLVQRSESPGRPGVGEEIALLIGSALEHSEPLRWIDGWTWLDLKRRTNANLIDARTARSISRARHARFYIDGAFLGSTDSATVILRLNDVGGDSLVAQASSSGPGGAAVAQLGLAAISQLLPRLLAPGRQVDFAPLSERRPSAIANWLQGEREYRQSQFVKALEYYKRAIKEDPALAVAAVKGAQAADWMGFDDDAKSFVAVALQHAGNLPAKYAHLVRGLRSFLNGEADTALAHYRLALQTDTSWAEAWTALGDVYFHLFPAESPLDSLALAAFNEARRADPDFIPPLLHLTEMAAIQGDIPRTTSMLADFRRHSPDSTWTLQLELMASCRARGAAGVDWQTEVRSRAEEVFYTVKALSTAGADWACSEAGLRELLRAGSIGANYQRASLLILQSILVAQRRYEAAARLIDSAISRGIPGAKGLYVVDAVAGAPFDQKARGVLDELTDGSRTLQGPKLWFQGSWYAHVRDIPRLTTVVDQLRKRAQSTGDRLDRVLADAMTARLHLARGDTAVAKVQLLALRPAADRIYMSWGLWQSLPAERMALAEILLAEGDPSRAIDLASGFDHFEPVVYLLYLPRSLALRYRAATRLGRTDLAQGYANRLRKIGREDLLESAVAVQSPQPRSEP
jgi:serine/threonine protein kinase/tetratricopeptide (TPR) repeat protein